LFSLQPSFSSLLYSVITLNYGRKKSAMGCGASNNTVNDIPPVAIAPTLPSLHQEKQPEETIKHSRIAEMSAGNIYITPINIF
jgi:hypothetical protein